MRGAAGAPAGRNDPCPCGSGRKHKLCCGASPPEPATPAVLMPQAAGEPLVLTEAGRISRSAERLRQDLLPGGRRAPQAHAATPARQPQAAERQRRAGIQLIQAGRLVAAIRALRQAASLDPRNAGAWHALGVALLHDGQPAEAIAGLQRALALSPDLATAWKDLGIAHDKQGRDGEAIEAYARAVRLAPRLAEVHARLGELHRARSAIEAAVACFDRAAALAPDTTEGRLHRVKALMLESRLGEAEAVLRKAVALDPANSALHNALADVLTSQGRFAESIAHFERSLELDPREFRSLLGLTRARRFTAADRPLLARMQASLAEPGLTDEQRSIVGFAIGKVHDDLGEHGAAMAQFDAANALRARTLHFDRPAFAARIDRLIARFTPKFFADAQAFATADASPLLILGMPRSGSTLVEQIVSSHPGVAAGDEIVFWTSHGAAWESADGEGFTRDAARVLAADYLALLRRIGGTAARVTDKLPFNFLRLGLIHLLLPQARIIHCRRHPVDTCLSIYSILFNARMEFTTSKADLAFYYRQYARLMAHWREVLPPERFAEVEYERVVADRETETRRLVAFAGLPWDEACLHPERNARIVKTASVWQARQAVHASSVARWQRYRPWLGELAELLPDQPPGAPCVLT